MNDEETPAFPALDALSDQHRAFVLAYCGDCCYNATQAAKAAGYPGSNNYLQVQGSRLMARSDVKAAVSELLVAAHSSGEEVVARISRRARANALNMLNVTRNKTTGEATSAVLDLPTLVNTGEIANVKAIKKTKYGWGVELHDAQAADAKLLEVHKKIAPENTGVTDTGSGGAPRVAVDIRYYDPAPMVVNEDAQ